MKYTKKGRWAEVEIQWEGYDETEIQEVYIMNDKAKYEKLCADDSFDQRVWFYFGDEQEFQSYFSKDNGDDWYIIKEIKGDEE
jgi:hypothetical protein